MDVSLQNTDKVGALFTVKLEKADYQPQVDKSLKNTRQKAQVPGFHPGMVPMNLTKKIYGKSIIADEVNKLLSEKIYEYTKENNINILGESIPNEEKQPDIGFDTMEEFEFIFDIALAPEFKTEVNSQDKVDYYTIEITDEVVENQIKAYTQRNGKYEQMEAYKENDMLKGLLTGLDEEGSTKEGSIQVEGAVMMSSCMKNGEQKTIFANARVNDVLVFNPDAAYEGNAVEIASLLKIDREAAAEVKSNFGFQVEEVTRFVNSKLSQKLFNQVFDKDAVKTEEEFCAKVKESVAAQFATDGDCKFLIDIRKVLANKIGKLEFLDVLLERVILMNDKNKGEEFVNENYDKDIEKLTWHLIKEQLVEESDIKVEQDDAIDMAREAAKAQSAQYGMLTISGGIFGNYVKEVLKKKESIDGLANRVAEIKLAATLKGRATLENKTISIGGFDKTFK